MPLKRRKVGRPPKAKPAEVILSDSTDYVCEVCSRQFDTKVSLARHEKHCEQRRLLVFTADSIKKAKYVCRECNKNFRFKNSYEVHLQNDHAKGPDSVGCRQCSVRCPDKVTLKNHIANVHERTIYTCEHCNKKFVRRAHVMRHKAQKGCDGRGVSIFNCEICDASFTRKDNLIVHLRYQHIVKNAFVCKQCPFHSQSFSRLIIHFLRMHADVPNQFICDHCGKVTRSRSAMAKHLEIHGEKKFECSVCGYSTYTIEVMRRHVLTHVADKPHKCAECGRSYIQRVQLQRHMDKHASNTCRDCGQVFKNKARLIMHSREHLGLKKFVCPVDGCSLQDKEFISAGGLQTHITKMHLQNREFSCAVCSKRFTNEVNMRRHVDTHKLERPRRCMYCVAARAYVRGEQLVRHVRKAHPLVFREHLDHVRTVLGSHLGMDRVKKSELESILNVLDAESDRILEGYGFGVLYGGIQEEKSGAEVAEEVVLKTEENPLLSEDELADCLSKLLEQLIDKDTLEYFGWPEESVDEVLEKVIENCGAHAAERGKWSRVQRLRENAKHLFLYVVEDEAVARMLHTHTIDQIVKHILAQGSHHADSLQPT